MNEVHFFKFPPYWHPSRTNRENNREICLECGGHISDPIHNKGYGDSGNPHKEWMKKYASS
jgi:hypothetical protein